MGRSVHAHSLLFRHLAKVIVQPSDGNLGQSRQPTNNCDHDSWSSCYSTVLIRTSFLTLQQLERLPHWSTVHPTLYRTGEPADRKKRRPTNRTNPPDIGSQQLYVTLSSVCAASAAEVAAQRKDSWYTEQSQVHNLLPLAIKTMGLSIATT